MEVSLGLVTGRKSARLGWKAWSQKKHEMIITAESLMGMHSLRSRAWREDFGLKWFFSLQEGPWMPIAPVVST